MAKDESGVSTSHEGADVDRTNGNEADGRVDLILPNVSPVCETRRAGLRSSTRKDVTKLLPSKTESQIRLVFKAYINHEAQKLQTQPELFVQHYGHMKSYQEALSSIKTPYHKVLAKMALAIGDCSAMLVLKQAIESIRSPSSGSSFHVGRDMSHKERLDAIHYLDLCMAHLRIARWLHIFKLYEEISRDIGGKDADNFVVLTNADLGQSSTEPRTLAQRGNPRNLEQASITRRMMDHTGADNSGGGDQRRTRNSMNRLRRVGHRLQLQVNQWGLGVLSLLGAGFTEDM